MRGCDADELFSAVVRRRDSRMRLCACRLASLALHAAVLSAAILVSSVHGIVAPSSDGSTIPYIFVPAPDQMEGKAPVVDASGAPTALPPGNGAAHLDLKGMSLFIEPDPGYRMIESALVRHRGAIGLALPGEPEYVTHAFYAPGWHTEGEGLVPVASFFAVSVERPDRWEILGKLRARHLVEGEFIAYALFPPDFLPRLHAAIRHAASMPPGRWRVSAARIVFSSTAADGFHVADVTIAAAEASKKE